MERRIKAEERNIALFLPDNMRLYIIRTCQQILISDHIELFHDRFAEVLQQSCYIQLQQIYDLLVRMEGGILPCYDNFEKYILKRGFYAVEQVVASRGEADAVADPTAFVSEVLQVIKDGQGLVNDAFHGDSNFLRVLDRACIQFLNWNAACKYDTDAPELLVRNVEEQMISAAKSWLSETELNQKLEDVVSFRCKTINATKSLILSTGSHFQVLGQQGCLHCSLW